MANFKVKFENISYGSDIEKAATILAEVIDKESIELGVVYTGSPSFSSINFEIKLREDGIIIVKKL